MGNYKDTAKRASCIVDTVLNGDLTKVNAKEIGELADIVKDMEMADMYCWQGKYYKKIVEAMDKSSLEETEEYMMKYSPELQMAKGYTPMYNGYKYYTPMKHKDSMEYEPYYDEMNNGSNRMYYNGRMGNRMMHNGNMGHSYMTRKSYMDMKEQGLDKDSTMHELEKYIQELGTDITEMLENATPEERQSAKQKLLTLSTKIQ